MIDDIGWYFLTYAYPALHDCGRVNEIKRLELENIVLNEKPIKRGELINIFPDAFRRMKEKLGEDYWTYENIKKYWWQEHNKIIDNSEKGYEYALPEHKEGCKVKFWEVVETDDQVIKVKNKDNEILKTFNYQNLSLSLGDYVTSHKNNVIEKVSQHDFLKYG
jgi:hypothetical protein